VIHDFARIACSTQLARTEVAMLILSRREKQRIKLGPDIILTVIRVSGDKVRLGIEAPADMIVLRDELEVFSPEERAAANAAPAALPHAA
jgi:carbon storage regulator